MGKLSVGKRISSSFKRAQPEVASFIRLGDTSSQSQKMENPILQLMKKKYLGIKYIHKKE